MFRSDARKLFLSVTPSGRWLSLVNIFCVFGLCVVSAAMLLDLRKDAARQADITSRSLVQVLGRDIARNIDLYDLSLREIVEDLKRPDVLGASPELRQMLLFNRAATAPGFGRIVVLDRAGNLILSSALPLVANFVGRDREYFRYFAAHADDGLHVSPPSISSVSGKQVVVLSRRLSNADGSFAGVVAGAIQLNYFRELFAAVGADHAGTVTLYNGGGSILMREPFSAQDIGTSVASTPSYSVMTKAKSGSFDGPAMVGRGERHFVFTQVGDLPLTLSTALSPEEIFAGWRWKAISLGAIVLSLGAVTVVLTWLFRNELRDRKTAEQVTAALNVELQKLAVTDALTGLFNRRCFDEALSREWRRAVRMRRPLSLLLIDADFFKGFNDRYGHQKGDEALKLIARSIEASTDPSNDVACRIGGEEFAIIFPDTDLASAGLAANRIRAAIGGWKLPHAASSYGVVTISGGLANVSSTGTGDIAGLFSAADKALYKAKQSGRNRIETAASQEPILERLEFSSDSARAAA
jgi:diguanylate cyclase (GGDEF)-like protein